MIRAHAVAISIVIGFSASCAQALPGELCFGSGEKLITVSPTKILDDSGVSLELAIKVTTKCFGLPYSARSDGLVLKAANDFSKYRSLPARSELVRLQQADLIPNPLPPSDLQTFDLLFGHFLWFFMCAAAITLTVISHRVLVDIDASRIAKGERSIGNTWVQSAILGTIATGAIMGGFGFAYLVYLGFQSLN